MFPSWEVIWTELRDGLMSQPRCSAHPDFPCVETLRTRQPNDILRVDDAGVFVRSHRTGNEDRISAAALRAWWLHLSENGNAALSTKDPNCPRSDRARLTGALIARCLPDRVEFDGRQLLLRSGPVSDRLLPEEVDSSEVYFEGAVRTIKINAYERDRRARAACIARHGRRCTVCRIEMSEIYGSAAELVIHVHHVVPISEVGAEYAVDPAKDLLPVCPNCHAVIHSKKPAYSVEDVRAMLVGTPDERPRGLIPQGDVEKSKSAPTSVRKGRRAADETVNPRRETEP